MSVVGGIHLALDWLIQPNVNSLALNDRMLRGKKSWLFLLAGSKCSSLEFKVLTYLLKSAGSTISVVRSESTIEMPNRIILL